MDYTWIILYVSSNWLLGLAGPSPICGYTPYLSNIISRFNCAISLRDAYIVHITFVKLSSSSSFYFCVFISSRVLGCSIMGMLSFPFKIFNRSSLSYNKYFRGAGLVGSSSSSSNFLGGSWFSNCNALLSTCGFFFLFLEFNNLCWSFSLLMDTMYPQDNSLLKKK